MRKTTDTVCNAYGVKFNLVSFLQLGNQDRSCVKGSTSFLYAPFFLSSRMFFAVICTQMHNSHTARSRANTHIRMVHSVQRSQRVLSEVPQSVRKKNTRLKNAMRGGGEERSAQFLDASRRSRPYDTKFLA